MKKLITILFLSTLFAACSTQNLPPLKTVEYVELDRFMGTWYVIANIPTLIEKGAHNAMETYTWNEKEKRIDVDFQFNKDSFEGEKKSYPQKAWIYDKKTNAQWRTQFYWPFKSAYLILDVAPDYSYTVIGVPDRDHVWIMSRTKSLPDQTYEKILINLKAEHFDLKDLKRVPQK